MAAWREHKYRKLYGLSKAEYQEETVLEVERNIALENLERKMEAEDAKDGMGSS